MPAHHPTQKVATHRTKLVAATAISFLLCVLGAPGCSLPPPDPPAMPKIVWQTAPPTGPYENNKWVKATRAADAALNAAWNAGDYRMSALDNISTGVTSDAYSRANGKVAYYYYPGPTPLKVIDVEESKDGKSAKVIVCGAGSWHINSENPDPPSTFEAYIINFYFELEDGQPLLTSRTAGIDCTLTNPAIAYFDPMPDPVATPKPKHIRDRGSDPTTNTAPLLRPNG